MKNTLGVRGVDCDSNRLSQHEIFLIENYHFRLPQNKEMQIELDGDDEEGFSSAYCLLPNFSKVKVL